MLCGLFQDEEGDFLAKLSKLICGVGIALIASWQKWVAVFLFVVISFDDICLLNYGLSIKHLN